MTKKAAVDTSDALESVVLTDSRAGADSTPTMAAVPKSEPEAGLEDDLEAVEESVGDSTGEPGVEPSESDAEVRPMVPSFSVLFQAPDTEAALTAPSRRRRAQAPAAAVPPRAPEGQDVEEPEVQGPARPAPRR